MIQNNLGLRIDFRLKESIVEQIHAQLRQIILQKQISAGDRLPTVRDLAGVLRVNFNTIARVYRLLDKEGFVSTQHGRGTYVLEQNSQPEEVFSGDLFVRELDTFIQTRASIYGKSPADLWQFLLNEKRIAWKRNPRKKTDPRKVDRKPGWHQGYKPPLRFKYSHSLVRSAETTTDWVENEPLSPAIPSTFHSPIKETRRSGSEPRKRRRGKHQFHHRLEIKMFNK